MATHIVNNFFRVYSAQKFLEGLFESQLSTNNLYFWIGKTTPWSGEDPDSVNDTVAFRKSEFVDMLACKKVAPSNATLVIPRHDWTSGVIYAQYSKDGVNVGGTSFDQFELTAEINPFYVFTDDNNIYKCLGNNSGATSSVKPTGQSTTEITTSDGYIWKFMYSLNNVEIQKFLTPNWVPIKVVNFNDGSQQFAVQQVATETSTSPPGGHGKEAVSELGAMYVMVTVQFQYDESGKLFIDNDFRKFGLLLNPYKYGSTSQYYNALIAVTTFNVTLTDIENGTYAQDDPISGLTSGATAKVLDRIGNVIRLTEVSGTFQIGEVLKDTTTEAIGIIDSIRTPDIQPNSGHFLTIEHQDPIVRASDQLEDFKCTLAF